MAVSQGKFDFPEPPGEETVSATVVVDYVTGCIRLRWENTHGVRVANLTVSYHNGKLHWEFAPVGDPKRVERCAVHSSAVFGKVRKFLNLYAIEPGGVRFMGRTIAGLDSPVDRPFKTVDYGKSSLPLWELADEVMKLGREFQQRECEPPADDFYPDPVISHFLERERRREQREEEHKAEIQARVIESKRKQLEQARLKEEMRARRERVRKEEEERRAAEEKAARRAPSLPAPEVPVRVERPQWPAQLDLVETPALTDLDRFHLLERASLLWVSNQSDDLLCLPYCRIERLDYQVRTALRAIGALRGRALLSDEVGLGKTIEAGLVLKEYLTRGMVRRFLVLTMPSLVDQWQEELDAKFDIPTVTTNAEGWRRDPAAFWQENPGVIASLHTLKQESHLALARKEAWDLLIVDEAHHLRNRASKSWRAVSELPRQFLLLLTATPVQNSLDELYHLVTLLRPGQLPPPGEFAKRFIDKKKPRQPREPEELRRLLNQVMIRNTRANAGIDLPSRRAETVLFEPGETERAFLDEWEAGLRDKLAALPSGQVSLRGRALLQAAGSSPAAWRASMASFPDKDFVRRWLDAPPPGGVYESKVAALPPLSAAEGGVVVFTQFIATQQAVAESLRKAGARTWVINGQTPAAERQPITESFRSEGGVLLLTRSGTEGRNLQFSHRLVNFDLPWNPMEIEQRIGRLHRIGQERVVHIYNLVTAGTLQAHLLDLLQEKLNLFELVVGETGLILGDRFSSDDFSEEIFRCWRESGHDIGGAMRELGDAVAAARAGYREVRELDETLFAQDYETT